LNISKYDEGKDWCANNLFSIKFCLQVLSMLMQHIDKGVCVSRVRVKYIYPFKV